MRMPLYPKYLSIYLTIFLFFNYIVLEPKVAGRKDWALKCLNLLKGKEEGKVQHFFSKGSTDDSVDPCLIPFRVQISCTTVCLVLLVFEIICLYVFRRPFFNSLNLQLLYSLGGSFDIKKIFKN
jgi:hypothetical protein